MGTGRDDFTQETIRRAAGRVGYRCSFPGCPNATIGASMESSSKTSITGVAAHICAAAKGGPRYDEKMTREERKGIENCLWLCQTHAHLIDTDEITYPAETLRKWKADAEQLASNALANSDYLAEYYKSNGENLLTLTQVFNDLIFDGQFSLLHTLLDQYKTDLSEKYQEFVLRYKIIYNTYCCRTAVNDCLEEYLSLPYKAGAESLAELFLSFSMIDELHRIVKYCEDEDLKHIIHLAINDELIKNIVVHPEETPTYQVPQKLKITVSKYVSNFIRTKKLIGVVDQAGKEYQLYKNEFYYHVIAAIHGLAAMTIYGNDNFATLISSDDFLFISGNIDKIKFLDISLQEYIWGQLLTVLATNSEQFDKYYGFCPETIKGTYSVQRAKYIFLICKDSSTVPLHDIVNFSETYEVYDTLLMLLAGIDANRAATFLDEHGYLYAKNSAFLQLRLVVLSQIPISDRIAFLERYKDIYSEDFLYHCLCADVLPEGDNRFKEVQWLKENTAKINGQNILQYIRILHESKEWKELDRLSNLHLPNDALFCVAGYLSESENDEYINKSKEIYEKLLRQDWDRQGIHYNLGIINYHLGHIETAKKNYQDEYDKYKHISALKQLMHLRFETNEYIDDQYFGELKHHIDAETQNLAAAFYLKTQNYIEGRKYFLRSLLIDDDNFGCLNGLWQTILESEEKTPQIVQADSVCYLKSEENIYKIALHSADVLVGITPNNFANCKHFSVEDPSVSQLLFCKKGDKVVLWGSECTITSIVTVNHEFAQFFFTSLGENPDVVAINASTPDEFVNQITPILKSSSEDLNKRIQNYNNQEIRFPLSSLANITGKGLLVTCEFLAFGNTAKIRNNLTSSIVIPDDPVFVLSYDSIVFLVHMGISADMLNSLRLVCSPQVKNRIISDIDAEISKISAENQGGSLAYVDDRITFSEHTSETRRERHSFLTRLKSFANAINSEFDSCDYLPTIPKFKETLMSIFTQQKLYCENGTLGLTQKLSNGVLVTDDQFLFGISTVENIPNIGLCSLISYIFDDWKQLLSFSKQLHDMNFINYLPLELYKKMVDSVIEDEAQTEIGSKQIQMWITSDSENTPSPHHEDVIIELFKAVYEARLDYLNPDNILSKLAMNAFENRNPGFVQKCISEAINNMKSMLSDSTDANPVPSNQD